MMASKQDYYGTLGVAREANDEELRKAYRRLARKHHPDLNPGDKSSEDRFKSVQEAYDVLNDPKKRQMYDQHGFYSDSAMPGPGSSAPHGPGPNMDFGGFDFSDFASGGSSSPRSDPNQGTGFRDIFSQFFRREGQQEPAPAAPQKGSDLEYSLNIDFWQSVRGTQVRLNVTRQDTCDVCSGSGTGMGISATCPECHGTGSVTQMAGAMRFNLTCQRCNGKGKLGNRCHACYGDGRVSKPDTVEVRIPAGAQSGARLRVQGKGNAGTMGASAGDLFITIRVEPHTLFNRDGDNINLQVPISVSEAGLGAKIEVPTVDGRALLKIPQGTQNGQKFRLREKGIFNARNNTRGDQIVEVAIQAPKVQDERTKEILRELSQLQTEDPRTSLWSKV